MNKKFIYESAFLHIAVVLLCVLDIPFFRSSVKFDEQPPIIVDLENVTISDMTNIPEKAIIGEEKKQATRKEDPKEENTVSQVPQESEIIKEEKEPEPIVEEPKIEAPTLIEEAQKKEEIKEEPKKESKEPIKEKKKPAPIPQRKPQIKPKAKPQEKNNPKEKQPKNPKVSQTKPKAKTPINKANPLASLMNSVDDLQKQIGTEDTPAQVTKDMNVNNMGIEGGNSKGSYFSELSVSGIDFVKSKIQESWKTIAGGKDDRNIEVVILVSLTKEGLIKNVEIEDKKRYRSDTYFQALADSAERAIHIAQDVHGVFKVLSKQNASSYNDWKDIRFTFTPLGLTK